MSVDVLMSKSLQNILWICLPPIIFRTILLFFCYFHLWGTVLLTLTSISVSLCLSPLGQILNTTTKLVPSLRAWLCFGMLSSEQHAVAGGLFWAIAPSCIHSQMLVLCIRKWHVISSAGGVLCNLSTILHVDASEKTPACLGFLPFSHCMPVSSGLTALRRPLSRAPCLWPTGGSHALIGTGSDASMCSIEMPGVFWWESGNHAGVHGDE